MGMVIRRSLVVQTNGLFGGMSIHKRAWQQQPCPNIRGAHTNVSLRHVQCRRSVLFWRSCLPIGLVIRSCVVSSVFSNPMDCYIVACKNNAFGALSVWCWTFQDRANRCPHMPARRHIGTTLMFFFLAPTTLLQERCSIELICVKPAVGVEKVWDTWCAPQAVHTW